MLFSFEVNQTPKGKARPRFSRKSGTVYTPKSTQTFERSVLDAFVKQASNTEPLAMSAKTYSEACLKAIRPHGWPLTTPVAMTIEIYQFDKKTNVAKKPDVDNVTKCVMDALNGFAYEDDKQVISLAVRKYAVDREDEGINVTLESINACETEA